MPSMADPYAKMSWAKSHLDTLEREVTTFCTTPADAYTVTREDDVEHQRHIIRVKLHDIPTTICLIAGDAIYSMRAALDQTVWALASLKGTPGRTQFPIAETWTSDIRRTFLRQVDGVPDEAICEIQALQPYHRGNAFKSHPLWRLDEICNLDKHRRIPAYGTGLRGKVTGVDPADVIRETTDECHIVSVPLAMKDKIRFKPESTVEVAFGGDKSGITETLDSIIQIHHFVSIDVLPRFDRFFS
jgi:hypothetical protein